MSEQPSSLVTIKWEELTSSKHNGRKYWRNIESGEKTWSNPTILQTSVATAIDSSNTGNMKMINNPSFATLDSSVGDVWEELFSYKYNRKYWKNSTTGETTWKAPIVSVNKKQRQSIAVQELVKSRNSVTVPSSVPNTFSYVTTATATAAATDMTTVSLATVVPVYNIRKDLYSASIPTFTNQSSKFASIFGVATKSNDALKASDSNAGSTLDNTDTSSSRSNKSEGSVRFVDDIVNTSSVTNASIDTNSSKGKTSYLYCIQVSSMI